MHIARQTPTELELRHPRFTFFAVFLGLMAAFQWTWAVVVFVTTRDNSMIMGQISAVPTGAAMLAGAILLYTRFQDCCVFDRARGIVTITARGLSGTTRADHVLRHPQCVGVETLAWQGVRSRGTMVYLKLIPEGSAPVAFPPNMNGGGSKSRAERLVGRIQQFLG
jgi:hypothetical protein